MNAPSKPVSPPADRPAQSRQAAPPRRPDERAAEPGAVRRSGADAGLPPARGKVLPPSSPVDVPKQPRPGSPGARDDEAAAQSQPSTDEQTESNWADGSAPQPRAKNARTHLF